jgi:cytochrome c oxidase cbb3-type subunit 3/ubiquinol-cytochrome c reductase cytochrome c subunit
MAEIRSTSRDVHRHQLFATVMILIVSVAIGALGRDQGIDRGAERRGGHLYQRMCAVCHGATGAGYKADQAPAITHPDFLASATDVYLKQAIGNGRRATTMSAWSIEHGGPLAANDVDAIVTFLRGWDRKAHPELDERPVSGDAARGGVIYARDCARCHGAQGAGGPYVSIGHPQVLSTASNGFLRHAMRIGRRGTAMLGYEATLGGAAIEDVVTFLRSWQSASPLPTTAPGRPPPIPLGPVPLNPKGAEPVGLRNHPGTTPADVVKAQLDRHARMALLDARAPSDYSYEHIAGAVSVPFYDVEPYVDSLPRNAWLVCYCSCPHAESGQLAQALVTKGFTRVTVLDEGLGVWKSRHYPTRTGALP